MTVAVHTRALRGAGRPDRCCTAWSPTWPTTRCATTSRAGRPTITLSGGVLRVVNTGPVVPPERFGDLFAPFRRIGTTRTQGAGLGLSIVAAIADAHGALIAREPPSGRRSGTRRGFRRIQERAKFREMRCGAAETRP